MKVVALILKSILGEKKTLALRNFILSYLPIFIGSKINTLGIVLIEISNKIRNRIIKHTLDDISKNNNRSLLELHRDISRELKKQKNEYPDYMYFSGFPYQSLGILNIFGARDTEKRFEDYELSKHLTSRDNILDIGCNCGFVAIYASYRTGCIAEGLDINNYMINIGNHCVRYLNLENKVTLKHSNFQIYKTDNKYSAVFSFATHWTDDKNYRVNIIEHLNKIHKLLKKDGLLFFESHSADVENISFHNSLNEAKHLFHWNDVKLLDNNTREFYIMRKL